MAFGTLRVDSIQNDGGTAKTVANLLDSTALGATVQAYDADTAKTDVAQNYTARTSMTERTITAGAFDLATGNLWTCGAIAVPNPTNGVAGQVGVIRVTAAPINFGNEWHHPNGAGYTAPTAFPAIAPFFVTANNEFLLGSWTEGIV